MDNLQVNKERRTILLIKKYGFAWISSALMAIVFAGTMLYIDYSYNTVQIKVLVSSSSQAIYDYWYDNLQEAGYPFDIHLREKATPEVWAQPQWISFSVPRDRIKRMQMTFSWAEETGSIQIYQMIEQEYFGSRVLYANDICEVFKQNNAKIKNMGEFAQVEGDGNNGWLCTLDFFDKTVFVKNYTRVLTIFIVWIGLFFTICLVFTLFFQMTRKKENPKIHIATAMMHGIVALIMPLCMVLFIITIQEGNARDALLWMSAQKEMVKGEYLMVLFSYLLFATLTSPSVAVFFTGAITILLAIANFFKFKYIGETIYPWDLLTLGVLNNVRSGISITLTKGMLFALAGAFILQILSLLVPSMKWDSYKKTWLIRGISFVLCFALAGSYTYIDLVRSPEIPNIWAHSDYQKEKGLLTTFLMDFKFLKHEKPEQYSKQTMGQIKQQIDAYRTDTSYDNIQPNIIYIMSEAFWDIRQGKNLAFEEELLPAIKELKENGVSGQAFVPVFGAGTHYSEFEGLTGFSREFISSSAMPYMQLVEPGFFSIGQYLKRQGYETSSLHPSIKENWYRNRAYPMLGLGDMLSDKDFENPEIERGWISDMEVSRKIISEYEKIRQSSDAPWFNFTVTMQNHTGYNQDNYLDHEWIRFNESDLSVKTLSSVRDYATGIHHSETALQYLIDYFSKVEEPTLIVFYGDHLPSLGEDNNQLYTEIGYLTEGTQLEKDHKLYLTPFLAWSNYKEVKSDVGEISPYMIMPIITQLYKLQEPTYYKFLRKLKEVSKGHSRGVVLNPDGSASYEMTEEQKKLYEMYELIQYDYIYGEQYISEDLFK